MLTPSCQLFRKKPPAPPPEPVKAEWKYPGEWTGGSKPITRIVANVDVQRATLYSGNDVVGWTYFASGIPSFPTPTGDFKILEKVKDKVSNLYGKGFDKSGKLVNSDFKQGRDLLPEGGHFEPAKMTYFMRLTGDGVGMHIGPIPKPGRRASHGCVRLPSKMAPILFEHTSVGTPVTVTGNGPDYQTYLKQSAEKAKANAAKLAASKKKAAEAAAAAVAATTLAPDDPNGPKGGVVTPAAGTTPPLGSPPGTPASPPVEVKPAEPANPAPPPGTN
ncbi:L,D-transpeptidase [Prosthecobacter sp.]|uniref:L,D-transpeptidase n=1 Tax=Prosthecobacter sp. TaxID=1965333 RepID=UPI003782EECA